MKATRYLPIGRILPGLAAAAWLLASAPDARTQAPAPAAATNAPAAVAKAPAAATNAPVPGANLLPPGYDGEATVPLGNYWDGVDGDNNLRVYVGNSPVLNDAGNMVDTTLSSCPNFIDMNDDGLPDLVVSDPQGFVWIYLNSGEPGKPAFTTGTFLPTFIGWGAKIHVCDWDGDRDHDILFGTFYGDIGILENFGTAQQPQFTRRMGAPRYVDPQFGIDDPKDRLPTLRLGTQPMVLGNYIAPWVVDWNKDGKLDLIVGEGTYSANSVRLLTNAGSRNRPVFIEDRMFYLCYGEGFEQLTPAVVDYDGDGIDDVLVGTRTGQIRMYKGTREAVEGKDLVAALKGTLSPAVLEFTQFVPVAGKEVFDVMSFVYPCDWNADGLFDLLLGSTQGKVFIALNQGSKAEPKFPKAEPVKGTDTEKDLAAPANWMNGIVRVYWNNFFGGYCNSALLWTAEKSVSLRAGSEPLRPVAGDTFLYFRYVNGYPGYTRNHLSWILPINRGASIDAVIGARVLSPNIRFRLKLKQQYELSFSSVVVGRPVAWAFWAHEKVKEATATEADQYKTQYASGMIAPSVGWQKRTFRFRCPSEVQASYDYNLYFRMPEGEVRFLLDDLSVKEIVR